LVSGTQEKAFAFEDFFLPVLCCPSILENLFSPIPECQSRDPSSAKFHSLLEMMTFAGLGTRLQILMGKSGLVHKV
jgi:hypothetical protein